MNSCEVCLGNGMAGGCSNCGEYNYDNPSNEIDTGTSDFKIPSYYRKNVWSESKIKMGSDNHCNAALKYLNALVAQVVDGKKINSSHVILLPYGQGKKTAMFTIIQAYLKNGYSVAPVIDVASLAIMENNFRLNEKSTVERWQKMIDADLLCVYGVDFSARYQTMKLFLNLCSMRALYEKPTLLFAENSLDQLRSYSLVDQLSEDNNTKDIGCKLSHPIILDGITSGRSNSNVREAK